jgi:hypothetical protein
LKRKHVTLLIVWDEYIAENPGGQQLFSVLRTRSRLRIPAAGHDAADPCSRRKAFRRLCGRRRAGRHRPADRRNPQGANLRRRARGIELYRIRADARLIGPATAALCELILEQRPHPEQGFRACLGIVRLTGPYGAERVEAAAGRAIEIGARTYGSVRSILDNKLDRRQQRRSSSSNGASVSLSAFVLPLQSAGIPPFLIFSLSSRPLRWRGASAKVASVAGAHLPRLAAQRRLGDRDPELFQ